MKPSKRKDISELTAKKLGIPVELVDNMISEYYKFSTKKMSSLKYLKFDFPGLGIFSINLRRLDRRINIQHSMIRKLSFTTKPSLDKYGNLQLEKDNLEKMLKLRDKIEQIQTKKQQFKDDKLNNSLEKQR
jgi:hypothetical protein